MENPLWFDTLVRNSKYILDQIIGYLPQLIIAVAVVIVGWLVAKLVRTISVRLTGDLDQIWHKAIVHIGLDQLKVRHPPAKIIGEILFWLTMLFFVVAAADILKLDIFIEWLSDIAVYFPSILAGALIILVGVILAAIMRDLVEAAATTAGISQSHLLGRTIYIVILTISIVIGIDQVGIDTTFLFIIAAIILGATLGGLALAFALGAKAHVANILAARELRNHYRVGDTINLGQTTGKIIEITVTKILIDSGTGRIMIPARLFDEEMSALTLPGGEKNEGE